MTLLLEKWKQCLPTQDQELWTDHTDGTTRVLHTEPVIWREVAYRYMSKSQTAASPNTNQKHFLGSVRQALGWANGEIFSPQALLLI